MDNQILSKLRLIESLQLKELKIYEKFQISLENQVRTLLPNINQPELLNEMVSEKKKMMQGIQDIESELSPLRKEIGQLSRDGKLTQVDQQLIDKVKNNDMIIIDIISRISKSEQDLSNKIKEQMERIKTRLNHTTTKRNLNNTYAEKKPYSVFNKPNDDSKASQLDTSG